jgi:ubiquinone/menaquinone biosynthesis C-methylase UbiE
MISRARQRTNGSEIEFDVLDSEVPFVLPYAGEKFSAVIASSVLEYVDDPQECFREFWRVCKSNGSLIISVPNLGHPRRWLELLLRHLPLRNRFAAGNKLRLYMECLGISKNRLRVKAWLKLLHFGGWQVETIEQRGKPLVILVAKKASRLS